MTLFDEGQLCIGVFALLKLLPSLLKVVWQLAFKCQYPRGMPVMYRAPTYFFLRRVPFPFSIWVES